MSRFQGKRVIVTGASSGIGRHTAERYLQEGAVVALVGRNRTKLTELYATYPTTSHVVVADVSDPVQCEYLVQESVRLMEGLDILVNNAGMASTLSASIETTALHDWNITMDTNLRSVFLVMHAALPALKQSKGSIVNVSSIAALRAFRNILPYAVSKAALDQLTACSALELAESGVRVNAVNPALIETDFHRRAGMKEETRSKYFRDSVALHPLGRVGTPDDIARAIMFLSSDESSWVTGICMPIDGGRTLPCAMASMK